MEYLSRISQSMAIMEYLNDISGGKLMPVDPKLKAQVYYDLKIKNDNIWNVNFPFLFLLLKMQSMIVAQRFI